MLWGRDPTSGTPGNRTRSTWSSVTWRPGRWSCELVGGCGGGRGERVRERCPGGAGFVVGAGEAPEPRRRAWVAVVGCPTGLVGYVVGRGWSMARLPPGPAAAPGRGRGLSRCHLARGVH